MMQAFLKGTKPANSKNGPSTSQKQSKEKKITREKPLPWVEKVNKLTPVLFAQQKLT